MASLNLALRALAHTPATEEGDFYVNEYGMGGMVQHGPFATHSDSVTHGRSLARRNRADKTDWQGRSVMFSTGMGGWSAVAGVTVARA